MKKEHLTELIEESIKQELNVAELYKLFSENLQSDHDFWWQLYMEEKSHASLIRAARDSFMKRGKFPEALVYDSLEDLKSSNAKITGKLKQYRAHLPDRTEACQAAIELEQEAGEMHYTLFMEKQTDNKLESVFQQLNRDDKDHAKRIRAHLESIIADA